MPDPAFYAECLQDSHDELADATAARARRHRSDAPHIARPADRPRARRVVDLAPGRWRSGRAPDIALASAVRMHFGGPSRPLSVPPVTEVLDLRARGVRSRPVSENGVRAPSPPSKPWSSSPCWSTALSWLHHRSSASRARRPPPRARPARLHRLGSLDRAAASVPAHPWILGPRVGPGSQHGTDGRDRRGHREAARRRPRTPRRERECGGLELGRDLRPRAGPAPSRRPCVR